MSKILEEELSCSPFEPNDDILKLDCRELEGSDPLGVHEFIHKYAVKSHNSRLSSIYVVRYKGMIVACFTLSMFLITSRRLTDGDQVKDIPIKQYPAILLGQMCVDKQYRNRDIGKYICKFSLGLAYNTSKRVACACLVLHTDEKRRDYYVNKCGFSRAKEEPNDKTIWLYRRVA